MGFLSKIVKPALSGIPFVGAGFAAQDQRDFSAEQAHQARIFNEAESARNRRFSEAENQKNRDFQRMMSGTAHQRQMNDMRLAGLNPILSAGAGASTPAGSSIGGSAATSPMAQGSMGSDAPSSAAIVKDIMNLTRQKAQKEVAKIDQETKTSSAIEKVQQAQTKAVNNSAKKLENEAKILEHNSKKAKAEGNFYDQHGDTMMKLHFINTGANTAGSLINTVNPFKGLQKLLPKGSTKIKNNNLSPKQKFNLRQRDQEAKDFINRNRY